MKTIPRSTAYFALFLGLFGVAALSAGEPGYVWKTRIYDGHVPVLTGVADDGSGRMVACGTHGIVLVSGDHGASWTLHQGRIPTGMNGLTWTGDHFLAACGYPLGVMGGGMMDSRDGVHWGATCLGFGPPFFGVAANSKVAVAVGKMSAIARTTDGIHWDFVFSATNDPDIVFLDVVWTGKQFVAVGTDGLIVTSPDGETWTVRKSSSDIYINSVASNGTRIVAVGHDCSDPANCRPLILESSDGESWSQTDTSAYSDFSLNAVVWTGTRFVALGDPGHAMTSPHSYTWSHHYTPNTFVVFGLDWDGARLVAVGNGGGVVSTDQAAPDSWSDWRIDQAPPPDAGFALSTVAQGSISGGAMRAVAVGSAGTVVTSDDEFESIQVRPAPTGDNLKTICATTVSSSRFLAAGENGRILTSADGVSWNSFTTGVAVDWSQAVWCWRSAGIFDTSFGILVGAGGIIATSDSRDPTHWTFRNSTTSNDLHGVADGRVLVGAGGLSDVRNRLVAVGDAGTILVSEDDGATWNKPANTGITEDLLGVASMDRGFVAFGVTTSSSANFTSSIYTSPNGYEWSKRNIWLNRLTSISWAGSQIIATASGGSIIASADGGEHWSMRHSADTLAGYGGSNPLSGVAELASGRLVAVGPQTTILTSDTAPTFADWIAAQSPPAGQDGPDDDPNHDGVSNLLACALGIPAVGPTNQANRQALPRIVNPKPDSDLVVHLETNPNLPADVALFGEVSPDLKPGSWKHSLIYLPGRPCNTLTISVDQINGDFDFSFDTVILPPEGDEMFFVFPKKSDFVPRFMRLRAELLR